MTTRRKSRAAGIRERKMPSELTLNGQYAVTCKGVIDNRANTPAEMAWGIPQETPEHYYHNWMMKLPDYLSDDAEFGRMMKALWVANKVGSMDHIQWSKGETFALNGIHYSTPNEAAARACIALGLRVSDGARVEDGR